MRKNCSIVLSGWTNLGSHGVAKVELVISVCLFLLRLGAFARAACKVICIKIT